MAKFPNNSEVMSFTRNPTIVHVELTKSDPAGTYTVPVKAGTFVHIVGGVVDEVFSATSPSLKIGDGSDDDGYADNTDLALGTAKSATVPAVKLAEDAGNPYANGKYYDADDTIDFVFDPGTTDLSTGRWLGFVIMSSVRNDGIDA